MTRCVAYVDNTNLVELKGLKSATEESFINDAVVTLTVLDSDGEEVAGQTWPVVMEAVGTDGEGDYQAVIEHDAELVAGQEYTAVIEANAGENRRGQWEFAFTPKTRRGA
jgi:hypothetical protein